MELHRHAAVRHASVRGVGRIAHLRDFYAVIDAVAVRVAPVGLPVPVRVGPARIRTPLALLHVRQPVSVRIRVRVVVRTRRLRVVGEGVEPMRIFPSVWHAVSI